MHYEAEYQSRVTGELFYAPLVNVNGHWYLKETNDLAEITPTRSELNFVGYKLAGAERLRGCDYSEEEARMFQVLPRVEIAPVPIAPSQSEPSQAGYSDPPREAGEGSFPYLQRCAAAKRIFEDRLREENRAAALAAGARPTGRRAQEIEATLRQAEQISRIQTERRMAGSGLILGDENN